MPAKNDDYKKVNFILKFNKKYIYNIQNIYKKIN